MALSLELKASIIIMCGVTGLVASFTSSSSAMCECGSTRPGVTNLPLASMTVASAGALTLAPKVAILPAWISTLPCSIFP